MADIRTARPDDLDGVFDLLSTRSRAAFGISEIVRDHVSEALSRTNGTDRWVALERPRIVGYASLDSSQDLVHAAVDPGVADALLAQAETRARERRFDHVAVTAVPEDRPLSSLVERHQFAHDRDVLRMWRSLDEAVPVRTGRPVFRFVVRGLGRRARARAARSELRRVGHVVRCACHTMSGSRS